MDKLLPSFIHLISYQLRNVTHWTFSFTLSTAGHSYLYSRNPWCAIFPVNPRQTLEQQANGSVDLIWRRLRTPPVFSFPFFSLFSYVISFFANSSLWAPDTSAALRKTNILIVFGYAHQDSLFKFWAIFLFFVPFISVYNLKVIVGLKKMKEKDSILCLQYLLPLQVVPEAPPHPVIDGERLRIAYNGYLITNEWKTVFVFSYRRTRNSCRSLDSLVAGWPLRRGKKSVCSHSLHFQEGSGVMLAYPSLR